MLNQVQNIIKLINLIKERPSIYDFSLEDHRNRAYVESLWKEVADELGTTVIECKRKWVSLRNGLSRDIRNEEGSTNQYKKRKWYLADNLGFLRIFLIQKYKLHKSDVSGDEGLTNHTMEETMNFFDHTTQDAINNYLTEEEYNNNLASGKTSFGSETSNIMKEIKQNQGLSLPPENAVPQLTQAEKQNPGISHVEASPGSQSLNQLRNTHKIKPNIVSASRSTGPYTKPSPNHMNEQLILGSPVLPPMIPFSNSISYSVETREEKLKNLDERNMTFFRSIIPDILRLSDRKQRLYKQNVIKKINKLLDE